MRQIGTGRLPGINRGFTVVCHVALMDHYRRNPDSWIRQIFSAKAVERGAVVRRSVAIVEREIGRKRLISEVDRRGYHLIECGGQFVIICNSGRIKLHR